MRKRTEEEVAGRDKDRIGRTRSEGVDRASRVASAALQVGHGPRCRPGGFRGQAQRTRRIEAWPA